MKRANEMWNRLGEQVVEVITDRDRRTIGLTGVVVGINENVTKDYDNTYDILVEFDEDILDVGHDGQGSLIKEIGRNENNGNCWWLRDEDVKVIVQDFIKF